MLDGADTLLGVRDLTVGFRGSPSWVVNRVSFDILPGEVVALVGESGSGKTLTGKSLIRLLPRGAEVAGGTARFRSSQGDVDLLNLSQRQMRDVRGAQISMIFQEPMTALSPLHTVGEQVAEVLRLHGESGADVKKAVLSMFGEVGFPSPERAWSAYPFELSGGLRQRAVIAMAMVANPALLIADEPTTALDVTTQAMVLDLLNRLRRDHNTAVILVSHDLGVVANMADHVLVMRNGQVVESGPPRIVLSQPGHGYTRALIAAAPTIPQEVAAHVARTGEDFIVRAANLGKTYAGRHRAFGPNDPPVRAVADFNMVLERGRTVAVVGESGSGKSTVAKLILRAERPDPGAVIEFCGSDGAHLDVATLNGESLKAFRRNAQMVFQDPYGSLSPRMSIQDILTEPMKVHGLGTRRDRRERAAYLIRRVGMSADHLARFPLAFSGGQRQRIAIARALALQPELLVCDEPTSALDVSVQKEVLELLAELGEEMGLSYLFISHDLAVVARLADRVMVMRRGRVVEEGATDSIFNNPRHPYTRALIAASPEPDVDRRLDLKAVAAGAGEPETWPDPFRYTKEDAPSLVEIAPGHLVRQAA